MDDDKIVKALEAGFGKVHPSPGLLNRIKVEADRLAWNGIPARSSFWSRLRIDSVMEFAIICVLIISLVGFTAYRIAHPEKVPAGRNHGSTPPGHIDEGPRPPQCAGVQIKPKPDPGKVAVFFTCTGDTLPATPRAVLRDASVKDEELRTALKELVKGPNDDERAQGFTSYFSSQTAEMLNSVTVTGGRAVVDFKDLSHQMNNASTAAGAGQLLRELNRTVFQFDEIEEVQFQFDGSCDAFFQWLQSSCTVISAADYR